MISVATTPVAKVLPRPMPVPVAEVVLLVFALAVCIVPYWTVILPPSTDLPQHLAQLQLLEQTLAGLRPDLAVTPWFYPNTLVYWFFFSIWELADPITVGKLVMSTLAGFWVGSAWLLARQYERPTVNWLIGVPLVFNFIFLWGFLNFLIGWPLFCLFLVVAGKPASHSRNLCLMLAALLLYYAHALWFAMASAWFVLRAIEEWRKRFWTQLWPLLPTGLLAMAWFPQLAAQRKLSGVETGMKWLVFPHERLGLNYLEKSTLGSIPAGIEQLFCLLIGVWLVSVVVTRWSDLQRVTDKSLLTAAGLMLLAFFLLPDMYMNTIFFNQRWLPCAVCLLLLALPAPHIPGLYLRTAGVGLIIAFSVVTIKQWHEWEEEYLGGFLDAISLLSKGERIMTLNLNDGSAFVYGRPGLQIFAYAQVLRGAETHFSFTEHYSGVVQFRQSPPPNPNNGWSSFHRTQAQVQAFDKVLVSGDEQMHEFARKRWGIVPINEAQTSWRLYRNGS